MNSGEVNKVSCVWEVRHGRDEGDGKLILDPENVSLERCPAALEKHHFPASWH